MFHCLRSATRASIEKPRWIFFVFFLVLASQGRFFSIFYLQRGFSNSQIGTLLACKSIVDIIAIPIWSAVSDLINERRILLKRLVVASTCVFLLQALPELGILPMDVTVNRDAANGIATSTATGAYFVYMLCVRLICTFFLSPCFVLVDTVCLETLAENVKVQLQAERAWARRQIVSRPNLIKGGGGDLSLSPRDPDGDDTEATAAGEKREAVAARREKEEEDAKIAEAKKSYGVERLFGAVSWLLLHIILGLFLDVFSTAVMYVSLLLMSVVFLLVLDRFRPKQLDVATVNYLELLNTGMEEEGEEDAEEEEKQHQQQGHGIEERGGKGGVDGLGDRDGDRDGDDELSAARHGAERVRGRRGSRAAAASVSLSSLDCASIATKTLSSCSLLTQSRQTIVFFSSLLVLNIGMSLVENLFFLFFQEDLNASNTLSGVSVLVTVTFEIPMFLYSQKILETVGARYLLIIAACAYATRVFAYTVVPVAWMVLLVEPLHGVTYACSKLSAVQFAATLSEPGLAATAQGLAASTGSVGFAFGPLIGGLVLDTFGSVVLYRGAAILVACSVVANLMVWQEDGDVHVRGGGEGGGGGRPVGGGSSYYAKADDEDDDVAAFEEEHAHSGIEMKASAVSGSRLGMNEHAYARELGDMNGKEGAGFRSAAPVKMLQQQARRQDLDLAIVIDASTFYGDDTDPADADELLAL